MNEKQTTPAKPEPRHRVGTLTLGVSLVAMGVLLVLHAVWPDISLISALKFAPAVLILLGVEVLVAASKGKGRLLYDGVSIFLCFVALCAGACATVAEVVVDELQQEYVQYARTQEWAEAETTPHAPELAENAPATAEQAAK